MYREQTDFLMTYKYKGKLNKKATKYTTCPCIPHISIAEFMRVHTINREQVFRLARKKYLSMGRTKKRYFVAIMPQYKDIPIWELLEY